MRRAFLLLATLALVAGCDAKQASNNVVRVAVTDDGFVPAVVTLPKGGGSTLVITRKVDGTCATEAVFAATGKSYPLPLNQDVRIPIATAKAETLEYACGMGMYHGKVVIQ